MLLALIVRRKLLLRRRVRRWADPDTNAAVIHAYRYLTRLTRWGGAIPPEAEALAKKARFSQHRLTEAERRTVLSAARTQGAKTDRKLPWWKRLAFRYLAGL